MDYTPEELKQIITKCLQKKEPKATLTISECVKITGIGRNKITELLYKQNTDFPYFKVGSRFLINREMLNTWLEKVTKEGRTL